jgi:hypothetical protein
VRAKRLGFTQPQATFLDLILDIIGRLKLIQWKMMHHETRQEKVNLCVFHKILHPFMTASLVRMARLDVLAT